jgi:hypothetical protein
MIVPFKSSSQLTAIYQFPLYLKGTAEWLDLDKYLPSSKKIDLHQGNNP